MFWLLSPKIRQNEEKVHKTRTKCHINYADILANTSRNQQFKKTRMNAKNQHVQLLSEKYHQQIRSSNWVKKKWTNNKTHKILVLDAFRYTHNLSKSKHEPTTAKKPHTIDENRCIIFAQKHRNRKLGVMVESKKIIKG